ncbi:hypothetical protein ACF0H5_009651 [Mactra antiquata]
METSATNLSALVNFTACGMTDSDFSSNECACLNYESLIDDEVMEILVQEIISNLTISRKSTSNYHRAKQSATDDRTSSKVCGTVAAVVLVICGLLPVVSDMTTWVCKRTGNYPSSKPYWYVRWKQNREIRIKAAVARFQGKK